MLSHYMVLMPFFLLTWTGLTAGDAWRNLTKEDHGLPGNEIQFIKRDNAGTIWIGTRTGLARFESGKFKTRIDRGEIWDIIRLKDGRYWVGTANRVILLSGGKSETYLKGNTVAPLIRFNNNTVWAISKNRGTEINALVQATGTDWSPVKKFAKERVVDMTRTSDGKIWVIIDGNGVYEVTPGQSSERWSHHLEGSNVTVIREDSKKRIWFGLWQGGIYCLEGGIWSRHLKRERSFIFNIVEDAKGNIWVATNQNGLWRQQG